LLSTQGLLHTDWNALPDNRIHQSLKKPQGLVDSEISYSFSSRGDTVTEI